MTRVRQAGCALLLAAAACGGGCAVRPMKLPAGAGVPVADAGDALDEAAAACRAVSTFTAEASVSGSVSGRRLRARLIVGLAAPASARLEAVAPFGGPLFIFAARERAATLFFPRERRVLKDEDPQAVLEALTGVPVDAAGLRRVLTGCAADPRPAEARGFGDAWRVIPDAGGDLYLHRDSPGAPWHLVAATHESPGAVWRSEYDEFTKAGGGLPQRVRLSGAGGTAFDLRVVLSQIEVNAPLAAEAFDVPVPRDAVAITLDDLKRGGALPVSGPR